MVGGWQKDGMAYAAYLVGKVRGGHKCSGHTGSSSTEGMIAANKRGLTIEIELEVQVQVDEKEEEEKKKRRREVVKW